MITKFLQFTNSKLKAVDKQILLTIDNPGSIVSHKRTMVIHPENKTFTEEEKQKITELLTKTKGNGNKSND
jgi:hypothetical protein